MLLTNKYRFRTFVTALAFAVGLVIPISAPAATLHFMPIEDAKFIARVDGWEPGTSVNVKVDYDTTYLLDPQATVMGGALHQEPGVGDVPGHLQFVVRNEELSPGFEICIFFEKQGDYPAVINFVTAEAIDSSGIHLTLPVEMMENPNILKPGVIESADSMAADTNLNGDV